MGRAAISTGIGLIETPRRSRPHASPARATARTGQLKGLVRLGRYGDAIKGLPRLELLTNTSPGSRTAGGRSRRSGPPGLPPSSDTRPSRCVPEATTRLPSRLNTRRSVIPVGQRLTTRPPRCMRLRTPRRSGPRSGPRREADHARSILDATTGQSRSSGQHR